MVIPYAQRRDRSKSGPTVPHEQRDTTTIRISRKLHRWLLELARRRRRTLRVLLEELVDAARNAARR